MLVMVGMPLALVAAKAAGQGTSFEHGYDGFFVAPGAANRNGAGSGTDIGAIEIVTDALAQLGHHILVEAGIGT